MATTTPPKSREEQLAEWRAEKASRSKRGSRSSQTGPRLRSPLLPTDSNINSNRRHSQCSDSGSRIKTRQNHRRKSGLDRTSVASLKKFQAGNETTPQSRVRPLPSPPLPPSTIQCKENKRSPTYIGIPQLKKGSIVKTRRKSAVKLVLPKLSDSNKGITNKVAKRSLSSSSSLAPSLDQEPPSILVPSIPASTISTRPLILNPDSDEEDVHQDRPPKASKRRLGGLLPIPSLRAELHKDSPNHDSKSEEAIDCPGEQNRKLSLTLASQTPESERSSDSSLFPWDDSPDDGRINDSRTWHSRKRTDSSCILLPIPSLRDEIEKTSAVCKSSSSDSPPTHEAYASIVSEAIENSTDPTPSCVRRSRKRTDSSSTLLPIPSLREEMEKTPPGGMNRPNDSPTHEAHIPIVQFDIENSPIPSPTPNPLSPGNEFDTASSPDKFPLINSPQVIMHAFRGEGRMATVPEGVEDEVIVLRKQLEAALEENLQQKAKNYEIRNAPFRDAFEELGKSKREIIDYIRRVQTLEQENQALEAMAAKSLQDLSAFADSAVAEMNRLKAEKAQLEVEKAHLEKQLQEALGR